MANLLEVPMLARRLSQLHDCLLTDQARHLSSGLLAFSDGSLNKYLALLDSCFDGSSIAKSTAELSGGGWMLYVRRLQRRPTDVPGLTAE